MMPLSVAEQNASIRASFPGFQMCFDGMFVGAWEGSLTPNAKTYRISILYFPRRYFFETADIANPRISVRVVSPEISLDPRGTGDLPPHIFLGKGGDFSLCLFDNRAGEWLPDQSIADTIIPWAAEWLFYFEAWLHSGVWSGGGVHPQKRKAECLTNSPSCRDPQARSLVAASNRIGRLTGTSVSFRLMAAASGGYSLPEFSRISRRPSPALPPLPTTSILPPALRRVESLRLA
jgi:hypothetical protein